MDGCGDSPIDTEFLMRLCGVKQVMRTQPASNFFGLSSIDDEYLSYHRVDNGDETGFLWRLMSKNSQMTKDNETFRGKKSSMKPLSVFVYANASGTQRLRLAVLGKFKAPRALRAIISNLPACYFTSAKA